MLATRVYAPRQCADRTSSSREEEEEEEGRSIPSRLGDKKVPPACDRGVVLCCVAFCFFFFFCFVFSLTTEYVLHGADSNVQSNANVQIDARHRARLWIDAPDVRVCRLMPATVRV